MNSRNCFKQNRLKGKRKHQIRALHRVGKRTVNMRQREEEEEEEKE